MPTSLCANKALRKERLLSIARELISNNGFEAFTINELASKEQLSIPTVHNLLGKKSNIFEQLIVEIVDNKIMGIYRTYSTYRISAHLTRGVAR
ncbi:TetR/AcrR family transcriptional regulator [Shewanella inventionis]|uniref:TetR/AcrR family transcriptional regulator n=1 Tax=Shewanella inventionis TaxID=1738770 RepID=UPI001CBEA888|nr:TetR/AcrR family transcriptional regulator [Shewanella inventionis]UAL42583.1 TetR/AcrR family transcriptional regulator [Shewanella inventionis]